MTYNQTVADHYTPNQLLETIEAALAKVGKTSANVTIEDLAPVDEFHIGGRGATQHLLDQLEFSQNDYILDVGCGLGGAARFIASHYNNRVTGIDLTQNFVDVGNVLNGWVGLADRVTLQHGSALSMPFDDDSFDGATMFHVGMNIEDKVALFHEVYRVVRPNASFGIYDIMQITPGELAYPVPWASDADISKLATPDAYEQALVQAGFQIKVKTIRRDFALDFFKQARAKAEAAGGPAPVGLHLLMQESTPVKIKNMVDNIVNGLIAPVEMIGQK